MNKQDKQNFVNDLSVNLKESSSAILVNYSGLDVKAQQELKKRLKEVGATMAVVKNTLLKLSYEKIDAPKEITDTAILSGQTALIYTKGDPIAPLNILGKFAEEFEVPQMKVGLVEGVYQDQEALIKLSKLPGKNELMVQVLGNLASPLYGTVAVLQANLQKLIFVLNQASKKS